MKNLLFLVVILCFSFSVSAQQTGETKTKLKQVEDLGAGRIMIGTVGNNDDALLEADIVPIVGGTFNGQSVEQALEGINAAAGSVQSLTYTAGTQELGITGSSPVTLVVDDADANATNELQTADRVVNDVRLSVNNDLVDVTDIYSYEYLVVGTAGSTISISGNVKAGRVPEVFRNPVRQSVGSSSNDVSISGQVITFNYRDLEVGELVTVKYISQ